MAFRQWTMGTPHIPNIDDYYMRHILSNVGQTILHRSKRTASKCSCWNNFYGRPNPTCAICSGSGYSFTEGAGSERKFLAYVEQIPPTGRSGIGDYITPAGLVQRYTHRLWTYGWEHDNFAVGDIVIFPIDSNYTRYEHDVVLNEVKYGSFGQKVYTLVKIIRKPYSESGETDPTKSMS